MVFVNCCVVLMRLGMALHKAGRFTEAFAAYEEAHSVLAASTSESVSGLHRVYDSKSCFTA